MNMLYNKKGSFLKYSDLIKFFEIYPEVTHIFNNSMSLDIY